ncbi:MAG: hypothetical protein K2O29_04160 [Ruminococcus sp.]|nr:hypothetical protein [Ruminococcus sp.]
MSSRWLDARNIYLESSLADLYKDISIHFELCKVHHANGLAVMNSYSFDKMITASECLSELMKSC